MFGQFLNGRYGTDRLTLALLFLSVMLINLDYVWIAGVILLGFAIFRTLSRNINKRTRELQWFDRITYKIRPYFNPVAVAINKGFRTAYGKYISYRTRFQQRKQYVFIKCHKCKNTLRLPRNKGKLSVTCPVCKSEFIKKT